MGETIKGGADTPLGDNHEKSAEELDLSRDKKIAQVATTAIKDSNEESNSAELLDKNVAAVDFVNDRFPEDISPKEHFETDPGPNPLQTEEDYKEMFDLFRQERKIPTLIKGHGYAFSMTYRPYKETVQIYLHKTIDTIKDLAGETGKLPKTDVAIYLDKSARPVSWFVNELWDDVTDKPKPETKHLAIDRRTWFNYFNIELGYGEYIKGTDELANWRHLPIHDVTQDEILELRQLLKDGIITNEELASCIDGRDSHLENRIVDRAIDMVYKENDVLGKQERGEITLREELEPYITEGMERVRILKDRERLKNINQARLIAERLRGLFIYGGLSEEDLLNSERIMDYPTGMEGKNITIVDEVKRSGATGDIAKHFLEWAFPEARSVNFYVFYNAERLNDVSSPQNGQMLMIPFWYSLEHDDGTGRGIAGRDQDYYRIEYEEDPNNLTRARYFGCDFLGVPIDYETEKARKSLRLREQVARLRVEYEKGHIR